MRESGYYPMGAEFDENAPWNEREQAPITVECEVVIPTQKEMLLIYGVGGAIDYVQSSDKAKELPDKAVEALSKYLEETKEDK
jgi:hypothetical protein